MGQDWVGAPSEQCPRKVSLPDPLGAFREDPTCPAARVRLDSALAQHGGLLEHKRATRAAPKMWLWGRGPPLSPVFTLWGRTGPFHTAAVEAGGRGRGRGGLSCGSGAARPPAGGRCLRPHRGCASAAGRPRPHRPSGFLLPEEGTAADFCTLALCHVFLLIFSFFNWGREKPVGLQSRHQHIRTAAPVLFLMSCRSFDRLAFLRLRDPPRPSRQTRPVPQPLPTGLGTVLSV